LQEESGHSVRTQQQRLTCIRNLYKIGIRDGQVEANPFGAMVISTPAGAADVTGYRPFTKPELVTIFELLEKEAIEHYRWLLWILIASGCRLSEAMHLRTTDLKQTEKGIWYFDWKHEPLGQWPMLLKSKAQNNRQCPIHPRLIERGLLDLDRSYQGRLFPDMASSSAASTWFKKLLIRAEIWEARKTVLHSLRGTAKDLWREAGVPMEFRSAFTGHSSRDVGEASYGVGLKQMPDVMHKEIIKVDLSFL